MLAADTSLNSSSQTPIVCDRAVCWDFDKTIAFDHWHNILKSAGIPLGEGEKYIEQLMDGTPIGSSETGAFPAGLRNPKAISQSMKRTLDKGVGLAIVSFNAYPEVIKAALLKLTIYADEGGLTAQDVDKIFIRGGFPSDKNPVNSPMAKKEHLFDVMRHFGIVKKENLLLVDDTRRNCLICQGINPGDCQTIDPEAVGFLAVEVPHYSDPSLDYVQRVNHFVAPTSPEELEENDFLTTLKFVQSKLSRLNFTMSRMHMGNDDVPDPVQTIIGNLKAIKKLPLTFAQRKAKIEETLQLSKANNDSDVVRMIEMVEAELKNALKKSPQ